MQAVEKNPLLVEMGPSYNRLQLLITLTRENGCISISRRFLRSHGATPQNAHGFSLKSALSVVLCVSFKEMKIAVGVAKAIREKAGEFPDEATSDGLDFKVQEDVTASSVCGDSESAQSAYRQFKIEPNLSDSLCNRYLG
jgi:hypothetical protein